MNEIAMNVAAECKVVQCNLRIDTATCRTGARAYLTGSLDVVGRRARILARSRSGRWVLRWEGLSHLHNFRIKTLTAQDPLWERQEIARNRWVQDTVDNLNRLVDTDATD